MITIEFDDKNVLAVIAELQRRLDDMTPAMRSVGEYLVESTHRRFSTSTAPDGSRWAPNSQVTYLRMIERRAGTTYAKGKNKGRINAKGTALAAHKKPLIGETHRLESEIAPHASRTSVTIGSSLIYAAVQQFGAAKGAFGKTRRGAPIPRGNIPPRPFLGLSDQDSDNVLSIVGRFLAAASG